MVHTAGGDYQGQWWSILRTQLLERRGVVEDHTHGPYLFMEVFAHRLHIEQWWQRSGLMCSQVLQ